MTNDATYWTQNTLSIVRRGPDGEQKIAFETPFACIGSDPDCEVVVDEAGIPRFKYYLHVTDEGVFCLDLVADPGKTGDSCWLYADRVLELGDHSVAVVDPVFSASAVEGLTLLNDRNSADRPEPELHFSANDKDLGTRRLHRRLTLVGRHPSCPIKLTSRTVSSCHCVFYWHDQQLWIVDLHSRTGCRLDGIRAEAGRLEQGSQLRAGRVLIAHLSADHTDAPAKKRLEPGEMPGDEAADGIADSGEFPVAQIPELPARNPSQLESASAPNGSGAPVSEQEWKRRISERESVIERLEKKLEDKEQQQRAAEENHINALRDAERKLEELRAQATADAKERDRLNQQYEQRTGEWKAAKKERDDLYSEYNELKRKTSAERQARQEAESQLQSEKRDSAGLRDVLKKERTEFNEKLAKLDATIKQSEETLSTLQSQWQQQRDENEQLLEQINEYRTNRSETKNLEDVVAEKNKCIEEQAAQIEGKQNKVTELTERLEAADKERAKTLQQAKAFQQAKEGLNDQLSEKDRELEAARTKLEQLTGELEQLKSSMANDDVSSNDDREARLQAEWQLDEIRQKYEQLHDRHVALRQMYKQLESRKMPTVDELWQVMKEEKKLLRDNQKLIESSHAALTQAIESLLSDSRDHRPEAR